MKVETLAYIGLIICYALIVYVIFEIVTSPPSCP